MTLLAICKPSAAHSVAIERCHTNLWHISRSRPFLDIGLALRVQDGTPNLSTIDVFVGARVEGQSDLFEPLSDPDTAGLIFNEGCTVSPVDGPDGSTKRITSTSGKVNYLLTKCEPVVTTGRRNWARVTVTLNEPAKAGELRYVRFRLALRAPRATVRYHGFFSANRMLVQDFRFYEPRQWSANTELDRAIPKSLIIPLARCQHFLILTARALQTEHAPEIRGARFLESGVEWGRYFAPHRVRRSTVYYWDSEANEVTMKPDGTATPVNSTNPYRIFSKFRPPARVTEALTVGFLAGLVAITLIPYRREIGSGFSYLGEGIAATFSWVFSTTGLAVLGVAGFVLAVLAFVKKDWVKRKAGDVADWVRDLRA